MSKYERYKPSDSDWIGEVPEHWKIQRLKNVADVKFSSIDKHMREDEEGVFLCNYVDVYKNEFIDSSIEFMLGSASGTEIQKLKLNKGDVLVTKDSESPEDIAVPALVNVDLENVVCGYHLALIRPSSKIIGDYLFRLFQSKPINAHFEVSANGITRYGLGVDSFTSLKVILPEITEQRLISKYLAEQTQKVDQLISNKKSQVKKLKELRHIEISQAVTKGVCSDVEFKDSSIEWLDTIPRHWKPIRLKHISSIRGRIGFRGYTTEDLVGETEGALTIGATHITSNGVIDLSSPVYISWEKYYESPEIMIATNDLVIVQRGSTVGKVGLITSDIGKATINPSLVIIRPNKRVNSKYLFYYVIGNLIARKVDLLTSSTAIPMISQEQIENFEILLPPLEEQAEISNLLEQRTAAIDKLVKNIETQIEKLQELRKIKIFEAVTGKIKVENNVEVAV